MKTNVGAGVGLSYEAASLEDIAQMLDRLGDDAARSAEHQMTQRDARFDRGRAFAYKDCAQIIRMTTLKGS